MVIIRYILFGKIWYADGTVPMRTGEPSKPRIENIPKDSGKELQDTLHRLAPWLTQTGGSMFWLSISDFAGG